MDAPLRYVPSPASLQYRYLYQARVDASGVMRYHRIKPGYSHDRISRAAFTKAYNESQIIAIRPLRRKAHEHDSTHFEFEFYI
jgi:hypothetical protein